jgi:hypothetical protein
LLKQIPEKPVNEYPIGPHLDTVVIWQLAKFKEARELPYLEQIVNFDPNLADVFGRIRVNTVVIAKQALEKIKEAIEKAIVYDTEEL